MYTDFLYAVKIKLLTYKVNGRCVMNHKVPNLEIPNTGMAMFEDSC